MVVERKLRSEEEIINRMIELADKSYNCGQIMMILAMDQEDKKNSDLIRAMSGLADGCGFFKETCGIMTGGACMISLHSGKGSDIEEESENMLLMLQDFGEWFHAEIGQKHNGTTCQDIAGDLVGTQGGKVLCGGIILQTFNKINEILVTYDF
jgi:hypothetical protein